MILDSNMASFFLAEFWGEFFPNLTEKALRILEVDCIEPDFYPKEALLFLLKTTVF